ncbi:nucleotide sugar dehydrogenase [Actinomadura hallensis]|uniref:Nucleotide sugar dehydrogenase n=1 Tax=Actinomadura hallensis TaxID=337895 RepID=A0A543ILG5_9ACTN|nr:nucleotide sugar dehydrogenase [Actinomadura hallensis]TQM71423.1 nucleotide sugar dehydrogenase [Actinomadura hallensis]HLV75199.1 nucleotide sugar dehydrogenase [Vulgatibacteraceae bacterium]
MDLVVIGLGYVGLPLAREAARAGLRTGGLDRDARVVAGLKAGLSHIDDVSPAEIEEMLEAGFVPSLDESVLDGARTVVICVPTPLSPEGGPDLTAVRAAAETVARRLEPGTLVVLESTTYPGTTEEVVRPILETSGLVAGEEFHLAFSPERIDPGNPVYGVRNTPKIVGGLTQACASAAAAFYGKFVDRVVQARGTREAEMAKLLENTYRHVNIALVNEMAVFCNELGIDLWDAIDCAATKPFGFQAFRPGPGVGGHCIPIDPNYLSYKVRSLGYPFRFVELAQEINDRMPRYVAERAQQLLNREGRALKGAKVVLLGVTYKADIADQRESPARPVARRLARLGADLSFHDPFIESWQLDGVEIANAGADLPAALETADLAIVLADHAVYDAETLTRHARLLFDTRGRTRDAQSETVELL